MVDIKKPQIMRDAITNKGHNVFVEICIALLLFFISSMAMGIIQMPVLIAYMFSSKEYISMLASGKLDYRVLMNIVMNRPEWIMIVILISEIFLILIMVLYCRFIEKRKIGTMGFVKKNMGIQYLAGILLGFAAFSTAYLLCVITGSVKWEGISENVVPMYIVGYFAGYLIQGMAEEVLCRGYLLVSVSKRYNVIYAIVVSSLFFAILHGANQGLSILAFINLFLFGVFAALLFIDCENIWIIGAFHSMWNFVQGNIYGIQVSGTGIQNSIFTTSVTEGREIINGGSFGIEGGISVTLVYIVGIGVIVMHLKKKGCILDFGKQTLGTEKETQPVNREAIGSANISNSINSGTNGITDSNNTANSNRTTEINNTIDTNNTVDINNSINSNVTNNSAINNEIDNINGKVNDNFDTSTINNDMVNSSIGNNGLLKDGTFDSNSSNNAVGNRVNNGINTVSQNNSVKTENMYSSEPVIPDAKQSQNASGNEVFDADYFRD